jgi:peroxiredoxin Q/BCP
MLQPGDKAPDFSLPDADMQSVSLSDFRGRQHVVLYFYPRDGTPGCLMQSVDFSDHDGDFGEHDCIVLGVSRDDCLRHAEFRDENGLSVNLLSDPDGDVCRLYGVLQQKEHEGQLRESFVRSTFVIDKGGVVRMAEYNVNPKGHAAQVFDFVKRLHR